MSEKLSWPEIAKRLDALRVEATAVKAEFPDAGDFMPRFADLAEEIEDVAEAEYLDDLSVRLTHILIDLGYVDKHERQH